MGERAGRRNLRALRKYGHARTVYKKKPLEIEDIPENVCNDEDAVLKVVEILNIDVKREDIDVCHRIKRKSLGPS